LNSPRKILIFSSAAFELVFLCGSQSAVAQTGPPTLGLKLWLRADAGVTTDQNARISLWEDQSGLANNATQDSSGNPPETPDTPFHHSLRHLRRDLPTS
jgi:hypothetical protein